jgi:SAM-dependent methyltransferase
MKSETMKSQIWHIVMNMRFIEAILYRTFGRPQGLLGRFGGRLLAHGKEEITEGVISLLDLQPTDHVLEVGFGPGIGIQHAAAATPDGFVAGIDYSTEMVEMARERNAAAIATDRVELRYGDASELPYADDTFDKAFSINSMQVWSDAVSGLQELYRVLRPDGTVVIAFTPVAGQSSEKLRPTLSQAGFDDIRLEEREVGICAVAAKPAGHE